MNTNNIFPVKQILNQTVTDDGKWLQATIIAVAAVLPSPF